MSSQESVLVVDDDPSLRQLLRISLEAHGYGVDEAGSGTAALELARALGPDAVLLDLGLPDMSGLEVARRIRGWTWVPIVVLSVQDDEATVVEALDSGADDYLSKPFRVNELLARLRASLRRKHASISRGTLACGLLSLNQDARSVWVNGVEVRLTPNEFSVLQVLMQNEGRVMTHKQILGAVWGDESMYETQILRVHISNLRKKLERFDSLAQYIRNEPGVGYRLLAP